MSAEQLRFHLFPQLPTEVRLSIWRQCIPRRVCELDVPAPEIVFNLAYGAPNPCQLGKASRRNACPPVITRVCRESRCVAFETGRFCPFNTPQESKWSSWNDWNGVSLWQDPHREVAHLHWSPAYDVDFEGDGDPLAYLRWHADRTAGPCSLTEDFFTDDALKVLRNSLNSRYPTVAAELASLRCLPQILMVLRVIVIHAELKDIASTGLFGLLGDAPVQIVDAADEQGVEALFALAKSSQRDNEITVGQDRQHPALEAANQRLKEISLTKYGTEDFFNIVRPAYMFRLCTAQCNRARHGEGTRPPARQALQRGRGRGRARGR